MIMACYHPLTAWRAPPGLSQRYDRTIMFNDPHDPRCEQIQLPCGQCIGCRLERSRQWALRCVHEASLHDSNSFLTLTYADDPKTLNLEDIQHFLKRLRRRIESTKIKFFQCGEYGELFSRPHHHVLLFGYDFPDRKIWARSTAGYVYRSDLLEELWPYGFSSIGDVTFESAAYVARYCLKKVNGPLALDHYLGRKPEFVTMSRRPGIGSQWIEKYHGDVYPKDFVTVRDGIKCRPPRFYDNFFMANHLEEFKQIKERRIIQGKLLAQDNTPDRLAVKEKVKEVSIQSLRRNLEIG